MQELPHKYAQPWADQLIREFEAICDRYRVKLPIPAIEFFDSTNRLGEWLEAEQTIRLNWRLILEQPWPVTLNVFKHEMAHQLCGHWGHPEAGHGPLFEEAAKRLGVPSAYRRAQSDTPSLLDDLETEDAMLAEGRRFFAKVEKLLALARSTNEHEAALAMQKANELIVKHNLNLAESAEGVMTERRYRRAVISRGRKCIHGWQRAIGLILRDFFYVRLVLANTYDPVLDERHKTIELFGRPENVAVAEYCYHFLERELATLWQQRRKSGLKGGLTGKNSYYLGVLNGFRQRLLATQQPSVSSRTGGQGKDVSSSALVVAADQGLQEFVALTYPRLCKHNSAGSRIDMTTYNHGEKDGANIVLRTGVAYQDGNLGKFLPPAS